jgi:hypothetical protein
MAKADFRKLFRFLVVPLAMIGFVLVASQVGGLVLRKGQPIKIDSSLPAAVKNPLG